MTILEKIWYEELRPAGILKPPTPELSELMDISGESELKLLHLLTDEGKELFHKYADAQAAIYDINGCDIFTNGFRMGAKLMLEIMENDKKRRVTALSLYYYSLAFLGNAYFRVNPVTCSRKKESSALLSSLIYS